MDINKAIPIIEGILFVSGDPISIDEISSTLNISKEQVLQSINILNDDYDKFLHGLTISIVGNRIKLTTKAEIFPYIETMFKPKVKTQLSKAALETMAIIMFKQPITRSEIEAIRGVNVERALNTLQDRNLICEIGRLNIPGRPILYGTTEECMDYFGLKSIDDISLEHS